MPDPQQQAVLQLKAPDELKMVGNLSENWRRWKQRFNIYMKASGADKQDEGTKIALLLHCVGEEALEVYNTFKFDPATDEDKFEANIKKFEEHCNPRKNTVFERYKFWECTQGEGESIDQFVTELKTRAKSCEFDAADQENLMSLDRIVFGIKDVHIKE